MLPAPRPQNASPRFHSAPMAPAAAHRQASRGPRGPRASKSVTTHFCRVSAPPAPPVISVSQKSPGAAGAARGPRAPRARAAENSHFPRSSRDFKAPPAGAPPGPVHASRVSQTNRANSRRKPQTLRKASSPQGIQGGGLTTDTRFLAAKPQKSLVSFLRIPLTWRAAGAVTVLAPPPPTPSRAHPAQWGPSRDDCGSGSQCSSPASPS